MATRLEQALRRAEAAMEDMAGSRLILVRVGAVEPENIGIKVGRMDVVVGIRDMLNPDVAPEVISAKPL